MAKYGPKGARPSGRILAHNHIRHHAAMGHGMNGFRCWYDYLNKNTNKSGGRFNSPNSRKKHGATDYVVCHCGWLPDLGVHYRVKGMGSPDYRCDTYEVILNATGAA